MRILSLETSETTGSVAVCEDIRLLDARQAPPRTARTLAPTIAAALAAVGWQSREIELIAVAIGPGSFTGLRVGVTTAKTLAYAVGAEIVGVSTLEAIAAAAPAVVEALSVAIDAHRQQVFAADFCRDPAGDLAMVGPMQIRDASDWLASLRPGVFVSGPALEKYGSQISPDVPQLSPELWPPQARYVARLGWQKYQQGQRDDNIFKLVPLYLRKSAAEEKRDRDQQS